MPCQVRSCEASPLRGRLTAALRAGCLLRVRRFGRLPTGPFQQSRRVPDWDCKVRGGILRKDAKANAYYSPGWTEQRSTRSAFGCARVINDATHIEIGDIALGGQWLNEFLFGEIT